MAANVADWIRNLIENTGYAGLAFLMWLENVFPPIPSELVMPLAGYQVATGELSFVGIALAGAAGSMAGAWMFYGIGRALGAERIRDFAGRHGRWVAISPEDIDRATGWFERHGNSTVFFCRLIPGVRSLISIPAGIVGMNLWTFSLFSAAGTLAWTALLGWAGYLLGANFAAVETWLNPVSWAVVAAATAWYVYRIVRG